MKSIAIREPKAPVQVEKPADVNQNYTTWESKDLWLRVAALTQRVEQDLLELAAIYNEFKRRGEDFSALEHNPFFQYIRKIAIGRIDALAYQVFGGTPMVMNRIEKMPLPEQRRLAENPTVKYAVELEDGKIDHRLVSLTGPGLKPEIVAKVLGPDGERSLSDQVSLGNPRPISVSPKAPTIYADKKQGVFVTKKGERVRYHDIMAAIPLYVAYKQALADLQAAYKVTT